MKTIRRITRLIAFGALICFSGASVGNAAFTTVGHQVTITVPEVLSLTADTGNFTLTFSDWVSGSETDQKTVVYSLESNDMGQADNDTAMNANIDFAYDRIDLKAKVGAYTKVAGNTEVAAIDPDFVTIGTANVAIAKKANTTAGSDGKLLKGTLPITYKGVATGDVPSGPQTHLLFITLTTR